MKDGLPHTLFYNLLSDRDWVIINSTVYSFDDSCVGVPESEVAFFNWYGMRRRLKPTADLRRLEKDYFIKYEKELKQLAEEKIKHRLELNKLRIKRRFCSEHTALFDFVINELVPYYNPRYKSVYKKHSRKEKSRRVARSIDEAVEKCLKPQKSIRLSIPAVLRNCFVTCNNVYELRRVSVLPNKNRFIRFKRAVYDIKTPEILLDSLEQNYLDRVYKNIETIILGSKGEELSKLLSHNKELLEAVKKGRYYNKEKNIGAEVIGTSFFLYTHTGEYILYEGSGKKYYKFGDAKVGIPLWHRKNKVEWGEIVVINTYSHPGLPYKNAPMQTICNGPFSYEKLRREYPSVKDQLCILLEKGREMILRGYFGNQGAWHPLTEKDFWKEHLVTGNFDEGLVSNL